jgi:hypothetical protein
MKSAPEKRRRRNHGSSTKRIGAVAALLLAEVHRKS